MTKQNNTIHFVSFGWSKACGEVARDAGAGHLAMEDFEGVCGFVDRGLGMSQWILGFGEWVSGLGGALVYGLQNLAVW